jgi:uncharacterized protein (DUF302 family)
MRVAASDFKLATFHEADIAAVAISEIRKWQGGILTETATSQRSIQIQHIAIRSSKSFADVKASLERLVPKLNDEITRLIASGNYERLKKILEEGAELSIFLFRDHGSLLKIAGQTKKAVQYEIGNPLTASKMTRHRLAAGLYAPLRVILYESETGGSVFEYDQPSSLFGQYGDEQVLLVARGLDAALERALLRAME